MQTTSYKTSGRLESLDIVRGITVAGMIMVNSSSDESFEMFKHATWNGLTLSDFVFPFFLFIMGVSIFLSMKKSDFRYSGKLLFKIVKRTLLLFLIGIAINWLSGAVWGESLSELRFWAVLQRIAVCYLLVCCFALCRRPHYTVALVIALMAVYTVIIFTGNGYCEVPEENLLYKVDVWMLGKEHLYRWMPIDPEGLVSTLCAVTNTLLGFYCAHLFSKETDLSGKIISVFTLGCSLVIAGFLIHFFIPYNKNIWSPSFALVTSGSCGMLLGMVMNIRDRLGHSGKWSRIFLVFGVNPLMLYVSSDLIAIILGKTRISQIIYETCMTLIPWPSIAALAYALVFVALNFAIGYPLYQRKIYIKL